MKRSKNLDRLLSICLLGTLFLISSCSILPQQEASPTATVYESFLGQEIMNDNFVIYLNNFPVVSTGGLLVVKKNNVTLTAQVDYIVPTTEANSVTGYSQTIPNTKLPGFINVRQDLSDGYATGTIKYLDSTLLSTDEVAVIYRYKQASLASYSSQGDGTSGPYYISKSFTLLVPGAETVTVWTSGSVAEVVYTRNTSFEADMGVTGYSFNYYGESPYIIFNEVLAATKSFRISYEGIN